MLIKCLGALLVIAASAMGGLYFAKEGQVLIDALLEMKKALTILKSEIVYTKSGIGEALKNIAGRCADPVTPIFLKIAEEMEKRKKSASSVWEKGFRQSNTCYSAEDIDNFISFGKTLGYLDSRLQISNIDLTLDYIDTRVAFLQKKQETNAKLYRSLGVLFGILVAVILI